MENVRWDARAHAEPGAGNTVHAVTPQGHLGHPATASTSTVTVTEEDIRNAWECVRGLKVSKPEFPYWDRVSEDVMQHLEKRYEDEAAGLIAPRIAERLALRREIGAPNVGIMRGRAHQHLKALRRAQRESPGELAVLEAEAIALALSLLADIGDATILAGKYRQGVGWANSWMGHGDTFSLDRDGRWHRTRSFDHHGIGDICSGDIDDLADAMDLLWAIAEDDYATRCLAYVAHYDCDLAYDEPLIDFGDPDTHAFYGIGVPADTPRV